MVVKMEEFVVEIMAEIVALILGLICNLGCSLFGGRSCPPLKCCVSWLILNTMLIGLEYSPDYNAYKS